MRADGWSRMPLVRMTNLHLEPGEGSFDDLLADVDGHLPRDEQELVDRRQAPELPVRHADRLGDRAGSSAHAPRRHLHRLDTRLLGLARRGSGPGGVAHARPHQLRQGARPGRARVPRDLARASGTSESASAREGGSRGTRARGALRAAQPDATRRTPSSTPSARASRASRPRRCTSRRSSRTAPSRSASSATGGSAVSTNRTDDEALAAAAARAAEIADRSPVDPAFPGLPEPAEPEDVDGWDEETAGLGPGEQAARAWRPSRPRRLGLYGYFTSGVTSLPPRSSTRVAVSQATTDMNVVALAAGDGCSGYADAASWKASDVDPAAVAREAGEKAARPRAQRIPGQPRTARPRALRLRGAPLVLRLQLAGRPRAARGAKLPRREIGERIFDPRSRSTTTRSTRPGSRRRSTSRASRAARRHRRGRRGEGRGVGSAHGRAGRPRVHGPRSRRSGPVLRAGRFNLSVPAGDASLDELVSRVEDGIYVTRLHYLNIVDPREGLITGMTRDGTFRIEGGKVTGRWSTCASRRRSRPSSRLSSASETRCAS